MRTRNEKKQIAIVPLVFVADSGCGSRRAFLSGERIVWNFIEPLTRIPGIGDWTAQYIALRAIGEPDAFPAADLGIIKALQQGDERPTPKQILKRTENWRPWRAYAAIYLWHR